jgi:hypothetical protein
VHSRGHRRFFDCSRSVISEGFRRASDVRLTLNVYSHAEIGKLARFVEALPTLEVVGMWVSKAERHLRFRQ